MFFRILSSCGNRLNGLVIYISLINTAAQSFIHFALFNDFTQGGSDRVSVHFAVTFLDC